MRFSDVVRLTAGSVTSHRLRAALTALGIAIGVTAVVLLTSMGEGVHRFVSAWWPPGHILGYEHTFVHAVYELMGAINKKPTIMPDFRDGARCVAVLDAVEKSIDSRSWAKIETVE